MNKLRLLLSVIFLSSSMAIFSQALNEAGEAFNAGIAAAKAKNYNEAIKAYKNCIDLCDKVGDEGTNMKIQAESQIPGAYYNNGLALYKSRKFDDAIKSFSDAADHATNVNDTRTIGKANNYIARVYNTKGTALYKAKDYDNALTAFEEAIEADGSYFKAYYSKGLVYNKQKNATAFKIAMDKVIELGPETDKTVKAAKTTVFRSFRTEAAKALQAGNFNKSIENIALALTYGSADAQTLYYATIAYNGLSQWQKAVDSGKKALEFKQNSKSEVYFNLGKAYEGLGNNSQACSAYKNVIDGPNLAAAQHKVNTELKCN